FVEVRAAAFLMHVPIIEIGLAAKRGDHLVKQGAGLLGIRVLRRGICRRWGLRRRGRLRIRREQQQGSEEESHVNSILLDARAHPTSTAPPLTLKTSPVMKPACSVHRKRMGAAISSGVATRPSGMVANTFSRMAGSLSAGAAMSVATQPGATQFTLIL